MRILLDECVHVDLASEIAGHQVRTVRDMDWQGTKNGALLQLAASAFDVLLTVDRGIIHQQQVPPSLALLVLEMRDIRLPALLTAVTAIEQALATIIPGEVTRVSL